MISASKFSYNDRLTCKFVSFTLLLGTLPDDSVTNMLDFRARKGRVNIGNTNKYAGTQTERTFESPLPESLRPGTSTPASQPRPGKEGYEQMAALFLKDRQ